MVRLHRRLKQRRSDALTYCSAMHLLEGFHFFAGDFSEDLLRQLWADTQHLLLPAWLDGLPLSRPWAWWEYSAPEPMLRQLSGSPVQAGAVLWRGLPRYWSVQDGSRSFETEQQYLERLRLITPAEAQRAAQLEQELQAQADRATAAFLQTNQGATHTPDFLHHERALQYTRTVTDICGQYPFHT